MADFPLLVRLAPPLVNPQGGGSEEVTVNPNDTVEATRRAIGVALSLPHASLRLCFRGAELREPNRSLAALSVGAEHFVVAFAIHRLYWRPAEHGDVPDDALPVGKEAEGDPLFLARAAIEGGVHPGKLCRALGSCRLGYGGTEHCAPRYAVLCCATARVPLPLQPHDGVGTPAGALVGGWEADGTRLLAAVGTDPAGGRCPGKTRAGFSGCNVGFGGKELTLQVSHGAAPPSPSPLHVPHSGWAAPSLRGVGFAAQAYEVLCVPRGVRPPVDEAPPPPPPQTKRYLSSVAALLEWAAPPSSRDAPLEPLPPLAARPRALLCHDMKGGYCKEADEEYLAAFSGWGSVDIFCYFSHHCVTVPPACWAEASHRRGVPCLGTLITEGRAGIANNMMLLQSAERAAESLAALCAHYGFDGWLVNIEAPIPSESVGAMADFLALLTVCCKTRVGEHALVIYYDSLDESGQVSYQNGLTAANQLYFHSCDGIFTNYWWRTYQLNMSAALAEGRRHDVYVGVDCFARGNLTYSAGPGCHSAISQVHASGLSLAVFAPGWSLECGEAKGKHGEEARQCDQRFWQALGISRR
ncbi:hypothetical protein AB1Y20_004349 [Prymnesium parvum]|uniref:Ubiquitin-like domain-containing protein n=1 Tax=Prymnesium parvum TaxID=97485 RepID=A0AB34IWE9_PRYPA